ncbi:hypothetical protein GUJ93_ZPchr0011g28479 [Zizania palustris]|uniref:Uncharacterized protein n=1 Tax=Zizania palustris TaxID=103762 RepID=A0A8J5WJ90_ZIZPA|nr:hypothetical protein GUJ93_ZPchr0011g28479 [Zizania palustris]
MSPSPAAAPLPALEAGLDRCHLLTRRLKEQVNFSSTWQLASVMQCGVSRLRATRRSISCRRRHPELGAPDSAAFRRPPPAGEPAVASAARPKRVSPASGHPPCLPSPRAEEAAEHPRPSPPAHVFSGARRWPIAYLAQSRRHSVDYVGEELTDSAIHYFVLYCKQSLCSTNQEMAELFASVAVKWALDKLSSLLPATLTSPTAAAASNSQGELEVIRMLERTMHRIHATLHDMEQHWNIREEFTKLRFQELKDLAYDAEDVVEEYEYEVNRFKVEAFERLATVHGGAAGGSSKRKRLEVHEKHYSIEAGMVPVPRELANRARKVIERFNEIKDYSDSFNLSKNDEERRIVPDIRSVRETSSFVYAPRIRGREQDKERVIKKLFSEEGSRVGGRISVLAIVGMGGLGKTTLAQLVYNDPGVRQSFDVCTWVCVSEWFDVQNIMRKIISSLTKNSCDHVQSGQLQGLLAEQIQEKRVFLVLDDVWNERSDCWEMLCMPMFACTRCDIVVTTRNEAVARLVQTMPSYNLHCLSPDESWSLFKQTAFVEQENVSPAANLIEIGTWVAEKCKGLPLALKTLGSILHFETNEKKWREVLESELWELQQSQQEVLPALELSYRHMPVYLKRCFVALSLFPKASSLDEKMVKTRDLPQIVFKRGHRPWPWTPPARRSRYGCDGAPEGQDSAGGRYNLAGCLSPSTRFSLYRAEIQLISNKPRL